MHYFNNIIRKGMENYRHAKAIIMFIQESRPLTENDP